MTAKDFFPHFGKEVGFVDTRSSTMPVLKGRGTIVGIRECSVELRVNNSMTNWYPMNSLDVKFILK